MLAARSGSPSIITTLVEHSEDPAELLAAIDADGNTALHFASSYGHLKCVRVLLQAGANSSAINVFACTPVMCSRTAQAGNYFAALIRDTDKARGDEREREREMVRRREGGLRVVSEDEDLIREGLGSVDAGRMTPTGLRSQGW